MGDAINFGPAWLRKGPGLGGGPPHSNNNNSISSGGGGGGGHSHSNSIQTNSNSSSSGGGSSSNSNNNNNNNNSSSSGSAGGGGGSSSAALAAANAAAAAAAAAASTTTRYALAEFRYGREEMLALFDVKSVKSPEILVNFKNLFVEKVQCPLALIPCTDDDVVPEPDTRRIWQSRSISLGVPGRGARGGSVDRGRGRGRGFLTGYQRSTSFYDDEARGVGRGERPWLERNGTGGGGPLGGSGGVGGGGGGSGSGGPGEVDWNSSSSSSPRKEFGVRARTANMDSWRRSRPDDEPSTTDWRSGSGSGGGGGGGNGLSTSLSGSSLRDKWSRSTSWREEDSGIGDGPGGRPLNSLHSSSSSSSTGGYKPRMSVLSGRDLNTSGGSGGPVSALRRHWDTEDQLPEWATENPSDYGGSFDASGAFHDSDNDVDGRLEDDGGKENHVDHRHHNQRKEGSSGGSSRRSVPSSKEGSAAKDDLPNHHVRSEKAESAEDAGSKKKAEPVTEAKADDKQKASEPEPTSKPKEEDKTGGSPVREHAVEHPKATNQPNEVAAENDTSKTAASSQSNSRDGSVAKLSDAPSEASEQPQQQLPQQPQPIHQEPKKSASSSSVDRMQEVADDMVAQLIMDDEYTGSGVDSEPVPVVGPSRSLDKSPVLGGQIPINLLLSSKDPVAMQQLFGGAGPASSRMLHGLGGGPQIPPPIPHPGTDIWYYRDPQGKVQGPFPASEMTEWYRAGYFDDSLSVRRACDEIYTTLGSLVALCGGAIPFLNSMNIPPIKANSSKQPQQPQPPQGPPASSFQQQQQQQKQHLQQQQQQQQPPLDSDLSAQFQFSKKLHLLRQQSLIMQKLASAEGWQLLSQEQQNAIIGQHMAQLQLTDGVLISPTPPTAAAAANASNPPNPASIFGGQPPQDSLVNLKQVQQQQQQQQQGPGQTHPVLEQLQKSNSLSNAFQKMPDFGQPQPGGRPLLGNLNVDHTAAGHDHLGQLIHNINFNHQPPVQTLPGLGTNMLLKHNLMGSLTPQQAQQQQQQQSQAPKPNQLDNDPIQSLLMQLSMHKQPQPAKTPVEHMSPWMQNATMPPQPQQQQQQQQQQPQARPLSTGWGDLAPTSGGQSAGPFGPHTLGGHPLVNTSMANEPQAPSVVSLFKHHQQAEKQQQQQQNQDKLVNDSQQQQMHQQQQQHHHHHQQQQQQQQQANHQPFERTQQKLDSIAAQQQQQNHQPFERTQQKLDSIAAQQQQLQQQQQQQFVQQQQQKQQPPAKDERKEQQELLIQQQQQQQHLHQQQQLQQAINKQAEKSAKPAQINKVVNNVEAIEKQMQQNQQQQQQQQEQSGKLQKGGGNKKPKQQQPQQPDDDQGEFINMKKEMEEKKRQKELKKQQQEEAKRKQLEEKKKLDELEAQKKAKLLEVQRREAQKIQEQQQQQQQQQPLRPATKVAPWSASVQAETAVTGPSLAEIQKAERERLKALARQEQSLREQQQQQEMVELQSQLDSKLKWNSQTLPPQNIKSLAEIQAEEAAAAERNREKNAAAITAAAIAASSSKPSKKDDLLGTAVWQSQAGAGNSALTWNAAKLWGNADEQNSNSVSSGGFWEEPNPSNKNAGRQKHHQQQQQQQQQQQVQQNQKQLLAKSKTMGSISTASSSNAVAAAKQHQQKQQQQQQHQQQLAKRGGTAGNNKNVAAPAAGNARERAQHVGSADQTTHEFTGWCTRALTSLGSNVDIPTFVGFLQDIESPFEVKDYIRLYLGETKDCAEFAKQFLERRSKYKNQMRQKNAHIDDMCKPAPAINPSSNDFQEIKGKNKKIKKNKMTKLDNRILGFSVTAAPDRLNVGDRDYGDNA